jgi:hypothetical protein
VARRQQFRELVAKRAQKTSALNPIIFLKVSRLPEALCICTTTKFDSVSTKNDYGYQTNMLSLSDCLHHPEALYKEMFKHLQRDDYYSTAKAIRATAELRNLLSDRSSLNSMMVQLGSPDARTMDPLRYKMLLEHLADMFFPGVLWFDFEFMPPEMKHAYGDALLQSNKEGYLYSRIRLNPTAVEYPLGRVPDNLAEVFHHRAVFRIATLLHEVCHAFLQKYSCIRCTDRQEQVNYFTGHGWAWQRIAAQVEFMAQLKLGLPLDLGRFCSIQNNWHDQTTWPSVDEVEQWDLHDALTWPCEADMVELRKLKP